MVSGAGEMTQFQPASGMNSLRKPKVTILQYRLFHYRLELFESMKRLCAARGIELNVVYGQAFGKEKLKQDEGELAWGREVHNAYIPFKEKKDLCWQPVPQDLHDSDLIVFMQENRLLSNYYWMLRRRLGGPRVAYWGHGRDFQTNAPGGFREYWKAFMINKVDWWFAYTGMTVSILQQAGFPEERITCLNNAIDTDKLRRAAEGASPALLAEIRNLCDLKEGAPLGLFCGSLYPDKKLDLLVDAADIIHSRHPDFRLVVIGDGSSAGVVSQAAENRPWMKWVGVKRGDEKAAYFRLAQFVLNPGAVGLHVLDAFALGIPMLSTTDAKHGPEIAYLQHGVNGLLTESSPHAFAEATCSLIEDPELYLRISGNAREAGCTYSVSHMAENFVSGIEQCIALRPRHAGNPA